MRQNFERFYLKRRFAVWVGLAMIVVALVMSINVTSNSTFPCRIPAHAYNDPALTFKDLHLPLDQEYFETIGSANVHRLERLGTIEMHEHARGNRLAQFTPSGTALVVSGIGYVYWDSYILFMDLESENPCTAKVTLSDGDILFDSFNSDGEFFLTRSCVQTQNLKCYRLWDLENLHQIEDFEFAEFVDFPDGEYLSFSQPGEANRNVRVVQQIGQDVEFASDVMVNARAFSNDGRLFVTSEQEDIILLWDSNTESKIADLPTTNTVNGFREETDMLKFSPDGRWLATRTFGRPFYESIYIWDTETGNLHLVLENQARGNLAFAADNQLVIYGANAWDIQSGNIAYNLGEANFAELTANEDLLMAVSAESVSFFTLENGDQVFSFHPQRKVENADIDSGGKLIVVFTTEPNGLYPFVFLELWGIPRDTTDSNSSSD
jgi:WD40 repeat protein